MILTELVSIPSRDYPDHINAYLRLPMANQAKILGVGAEGVVFMDKAEPGVVKVMSVAPFKFQSAEGKSADDLLNSSPYLRYAALARRYYTSNPYLPRIERISKQQVDRQTWEKMLDAAGQQDTPAGGMVDNDGMDVDAVRKLNHPPYLVSFKMEQLEPLNSLDKLQSAAVLRKAFGFDISPTTKAGDIQGMIVEYTYQLYRYVKLQPKLDLSKIDNVDPNLVKAIQIIKSIGSKLKSSIDLNEQNVMVRMSTGGPQLVITDPLVNI